MIYVALETSVRAASVAVWTPEIDGCHETRLEHDRAHASDLLPALSKILQLLDISPREITGVMVGTGPGSYTGLRVGIATALGLVRGSGANIIGIPAGETLAFSELGSDEECVLLLDARQGQLYFAHYARREDDVVALCPPRVTTAEELPALLPEGIPIFGDANVQEAARLSAKDAERLHADVFPRARPLLELGIQRLASRGPMNPEDVEPLYLRPFAAKLRSR